MNNRCVERHRTTYRNVNASYIISINQCLSTAERGKTAGEQYVT